MIPRAVLNRHDEISPHGRTRPILSACEVDGGNDIEILVKFSAGCEQGVVNLAREAIAACLAIDLRLPVPKPYLVEIPPEHVNAVPNSEFADHLSGSSPIAFGSTRLETGFSNWKTSDRLSDPMRHVAAGILMFDAIIQNPDRRAANPNCLVRGDELRIIDHELAFAHKLILNWQPPWTFGGMAALAAPGAHIFVNELKGAATGFAAIKSRWTALSDERLQEYEEAIPVEWQAACNDVSDALCLIRDARDNIDACISELGRILT